jgi:hypothetical protein
MFRLNGNKQKTNQNSLIGSIFSNFFTEKFRVFPGFFQFFRFFWYFRFFRFFSVCFETACFASIPKQRFSMFRLNQNKQKPHPQKQFEGEYIWVFRVVSVCFGLLQNSSVCFGCFYTGLKHRNKLKFVDFGFTKQTETIAKQISFRFVSVRTEIYFCLFRGHPTCNEGKIPPWVLLI